MYSPGWWCYRLVKSRASQAAYRVQPHPELATTIDLYILPAFANPSEDLFLISLFGTYTPPQLASPLMTTIWQAIGTIAPPPICDSSLGTNELTFLFGV